MKKHDLIEVQLRERVKELKCLYAVSHIANDLDLPAETLFERVANVLKEAMQYSDNARVSIKMGNSEYVSANRKTIKSRMRANFSADRHKGVIEIGYVASGRISGKFLPEERKLLKAVAAELGLIIKRSVLAEEKEKLKIQLLHSERLAFVGELSAGIAHELNEPLGRILGFAQLIKKEGLPQARQKDDLERIIKASLFAREIIKKLMLFSRQMPQQVIPMDLNDTVRNILYFIDVRYQSSSIKMEQKLASSLPKIHADPVQISQVVVNLITNAIHAMPGGGKLHIVTQRAGSCVKLIVKDTGRGMNPEVRDRIFEPFFTTKPAGQGTGLGLSVAQGIVLAHQGEIKVKSTPGRGSAFEIKLPIKPERRKVK